MGLLDDAIREHLELKRRRGASDDEVERKAAEAFGPVRRERSEPALDAAVAGAPEPEPADPYVDEPAAADPPPPAEPYAAAGEPAPVDPYGGEPAYDGGDEPPYAEAPPLAEAPAPADPLAGADDWVEPPPRRGATPPHGFPAVAPEPEEPVGEDVLEETPDFLQDAPEHDRLWFEQKPPRDFDFDE